MNTAFDFQRRRWIGGALAGTAAATLPVWAQNLTSGERRMALVIGNAQYRVKPLRNAVADARSIATTLREIGCQLIVRENATLASMIDAMKSFWLQSRRADVRVVYFSGHGMQHRGRNYLLPVDAVIEDPDELPRKAAAMDEIVDKLVETRGGVNIVILDACRTPPLVATRTRSLNLPRPSPGLAQVVAPQGTLLAFSTSPGAVAYDGAESQSPYTRHLVDQLRVPGQPIEQMFKRVRAAVARETSDKQVPWETSSLTGDFCFRRGNDGRCPAF